MAHPGGKRVGGCLSPTRFDGRPASINASFIARLRALWQKNKAQLQPIGIPKNAGKNRSPSATLVNPPTSSSAYALYAAVASIRDTGITDAEVILDPSWWGAAVHGPVALVQRILCRALWVAAKNAWVAHCPASAVANLHMHSGWGAGAALLRCPTGELRCVALTTLACRLRCVGVWAFAFN